MTIDFSKVPGVKGTKFTVRDIHAKKDLGAFTGKWTGEVGSHVSAPTHRPKSQLWCFF
jgi:hypothetical protein